MVPLDWFHFDDESGTGLLSACLCACLPAEVKGIDSLMSDTFKALDGFILVISGDGSMSYVSDNISNHLGLKQVRVKGIV